MKGLFIVLYIVVGCIVQILIAKRSRRWQGAIVPVVYLIWNIKDIIEALSIQVRLIPDYYLAAVLISPCIVLWMVYYIYYYYWLFKRLNTTT